MSGKSRDQKRKDRLAKRTTKNREHQRDEIRPYEGTKYQADEWIPHVSETELAIYETIVQSGRRLTNDQVKAAFHTLIRHLRDGQPALLPEGTPGVTFAAGSEVEFLVWNIRRHWGILVEHEGPVRTDDLIGILRTLLYSIEAHAWNTGPSRGYVAFLYSFIKDGGLR
jgi:hypothetical protein